MEHIDGYVVEEIKEMTGLTFADILLVYYGQQSDVAKQQDVIEAAMTIENPIVLAGSHNTSKLTIIAPGRVVDDYSGGILRGVQRACSELGYDAFVHWQAPYHALDDYCVALFETGLVGQGLFLLTQDNYEIFVRRCQQADLPYVLGDCEANEPSPHPAVGIDNVQAVRDATHYLLEQGHRRIGYIAGRSGVSSAKWRLQGYETALDEAGVPIDEALIRHGDWALNTGQTHTTDLLQLDDPPTAVMAANDLMAIGSLLAIKAAGLNVPEDVSLIGFDDISMASTVSPPLTTIRQPLEQLGEAAVDMLHQMNQQWDDAVESCFLDSELVLRESVLPPRQK